MDFTQLLEPEIQRYIIGKTGSDLAQLAFAKNPFPQLDFKLVLGQIEARGKSRLKLPLWFDTPNIIYPSRVSLEQTSSQLTALYKAALVAGSSLIDLTGGFGVDDYYFSKSVSQVVHCELNAELSAIAAHNFKQLKAENILCIAGDSHQTLKNYGAKFDWIYIDPSRRNETKGKVFLLSDCLPNVPESLDFYLQHSDNILIKTAPLLDISAGLNELKSVKSIHVIAVNNEVKELLWEIVNDYQGNPAILTVNFNKETVERFGFEWNAEMQPSFSLPNKYLYEPNAAIMKSGGFDAVAQQFKIEKLHPNSHLYTSGFLIDFPGRRFEIRQIIAYNNNEMKQHLKDVKANVTVRNFPESVENIRKKWKIKDGGDNYAFFTTIQNEDKIVLLCAKID